jgi:hypothetical protein
MRYIDSGAVRQREVYRRRLTSVIFRDPASVHRENSSWKGQEGVHSHTQLIYPFTLSPLLIVALQKKYGDRCKCLPKDHDLTTPNVFGCTTPWLSILTSNTSDANLSSISKGLIVQSCGTEKTHDGKAGTPNQNEGK